MKRVSLTSAIYDALVALTTKATAAEVRAWIEANHPALRPKLGGSGFPSLVVRVKKARRREIDDLREQDKAGRDGSSPEAAVRSAAERLVRAKGLDYTRRYLGQLALRLRDPEPDRPRHPQR
jgi:hypothetical protein